MDTKNTVAVESNADLLLNSVVQAIVNYDNVVNVIPMTRAAHLSIQQAGQQCVNTVSQLIGAHGRAESDRLINLNAGLAESHSLIEEQTKTIVRLSDENKKLTAEVERLSALLVLPTPDTVAFVENGR